MECRGELGGYRLANVIRFIVGSESVSQSIGVRDGGGREMVNLNSFSLCAHKGWKCNRGGRLSFPTTNIEPKRAPSPHITKKKQDIYNHANYLNSNLPRLRAANNNNRTNKGQTTPSLHYYFGTTAKMFPKKLYWPKRQKKKNKVK